MRKRRWARALTAAILAGLLLLSIPALGLADAGNFAGSSDYGSSSGWSSSGSSGSSGWSGGSSSGNSSWNSSGGSSSWYSDSSDSYRYSSQDDSPSYNAGSAAHSTKKSPHPPAEPGIMLIVIFLLGLIALGLYLLFRIIPPANRKETPPPDPVRPAPIYAVSDFQLSPLRQRDPGFTRQAFAKRVGEMYVQMQQAWQAKQWAPMRALMTDALFSQFNRQMQEYINRHRTNYVEGIRVLSVEITDYRQDAVNDVLTVLLETRIIDYVTDDDTGALISGSRDKELFMTYEWTLVRSKLAKTRRADEAEWTQCPNCGAPVSLSQSGQCEYCGSVLISGAYDWVVSAIRGISQRSH